MLGVVLSILNLIFVVAGFVPVALVINYDRLDLTMFDCPWNQFLTSNMKQRDPGARKFLSFPIS